MPTIAPGRIPFSTFVSAVSEEEEGEEEECALFR
jgi:hypothetical protein